MTLIDAARQALPGCEWVPHEDRFVRTAEIVGCDHAYLGDHYALLQDAYQGADAAQWLRAQVTARRDALDAALGEPKHLGTSARDWCGMWDIARARADAAEAKLKAVVASWPAHYHRQGCWVGGCNCGADAANAARAEARRLCGVDNG